MSDPVKLRLYLTLIVLMMVGLYIGPFVVANHLNSVQSAIRQTCLENRSISGWWDICYAEGQRAALPFWEYLIPYLPACILLWLNWLLNPNLRLSPEAYPGRSLTALLWLGTIFAGLCIFVTIWGVASLEYEKVHSVDATTLLAPMRVACAFLLAPLLFHHFVAPEPPAAKLRIYAVSHKLAKVSLLLLIASPIVAGILLVIRLSLTI